MRILLACLIALAAVPGFSRDAEANGRFPAASYVVVGPGGASNVIALRTTFGVLRSADAGRTWGWICEESVEAIGMFDPSVALGLDGTTVLSLPSGLAVSPDGCAWRRPDGTPARSVVDVSHDATGAVIIAGVGPSGTQDALLRSDDGGHTWRTTTTLPGYFLETVEVAPSSPQRVYVTAFVTGPEPVFLRSDDGGATVHETTRSFTGGQSAWIAGVDPTNPDVVYLRSERPGGIGTYLLRSDDGGVSFRRIAETDGAMRGFAVSDDGGTVWFGSSLASEGLRRSVRGATFARTAEQPSVQCLRFHAGVLYVCADEAADGYALGRSSDGGDHVTPMLSLRALDDPTACPAGSSVGDRCPSLWPAQRAILRSIDAGSTPDRPQSDATDATDATDDTRPVEAPPDAATDAPSLDASQLLPHATRPPTCGCHTYGLRARGGCWLLTLAALRRRRSRRRATASSPRDPPDPRRSPAAARSARGT